jgi:replicative superfamily II helicase
MGINTPASHVIVRDTVFMGVGRLQTSDILQMLGRAGRGDQAGEGVVLMSGQEEYGSYVDDLRESQIADIRAQLIPREPEWSRTKKDTIERRKTDPKLGAVLTEISRHEHLTLAELAAFFSHTYSAWSDEDGHHDYASQIAILVRDKLVFKVENSESTYSPTKLGRTVAFSGLSPESGGMIGAFIRALIRLSEKRTDATGKSHDYLRRLSAMDLYLLTAASFECRQFVPSRISAKRRSEVEAYIEDLLPEDKPVTNMWRSADSDQYPTRRLLSSLRFPKPNDPKSEERQFYRLMLTAMILHRHSRGHSLSILAEEFGLDIGMLEGGLKSSATWVLHCIAHICNPERCYKLNFLSMKSYELVESLSFGSNLGKLLTVKGVGRKSVQKVLDAGITDMDGLRGCQSADLVALGLQAGQARKIARHVARTNR